jgi:hypothetical protein
MSDAKHGTGEMRTGATRVWSATAGLAIVAALCGACTTETRGDRPPTRLDGSVVFDGGNDGGPRPDFDAGPPRDGGITVLPDGNVLCGGEAIALEQLPAKLMFVVDRSSSTLGPADRSFMPTTTDLGSCSETNSRPATGITYRTLWDDLGAAVADVSMAREDRVSFGLTVFPGPGALTGAATPDSFCTARPPTTLVTPALGTASAIRTALTDPANAPLCAGGFTPTRAALDAAAAALAGSSDGVLVLATDGAPNCGAGSAGCRCTTSSAFCGTLGFIGCLDDVATIGAITALRDRGIRTYVVGIPGTEDYAAVLNAMATAGGTARSGAPSYYAASDSASLVAALGTISDAEVSCRFALASAPPDRTNVNVFLDDAPTPRDTGDGFVLSDDGLTITLEGTSCEALRNGTVANVRFEFGCPLLI